MTKSSRTFLTDYKPGIMLDSGAFSAWYRDQPLELEDYIAFVKRYGPRFESIVALDVIPGKAGRMARTTKDVDFAAKQSHENFKRMRKAGLDPIPVFHQGEDWKWLDLMIEERIPYVGISPYLKSKPEHIVRWMDQVFTRISDSHGRPLLKTHGFGVTSAAIIKRYPWFSVDSTSWALAAGYGNVLLPRVHNGVLDYSIPHLWSISERDEAKRPSLVSCGPHMRRIIDTYFELCGTDFTSVRNFQEARLRVNALYFMGLANSLKAEPYQHRKHDATFKVKPIVEFNYSPRIILATMMKIYQQGQILSEIEAPHRLISYFDARRFNEERINEYTGQGFCVKDRFRYRPDTKSYKLRRLRHLVDRLNQPEEEDLDT